MTCVLLGEVVAREAVDGVGRELVEQLLDWAHGAGFAGVELEAYRMNTAASILYRSLGFRRVARERYSFHMDDWDFED